MESKKFKIVGIVVAIAISLLVVFGLDYLKETNLFSSTELNIALGIVFVGLIVFTIVRRKTILNRKK